MSQFAALSLLRQVRRRLVDLSLDGNYLRDSDLARILKGIWEGPPDSGGLVSDMWVEAAFPAKQSTVTLQELVNEHRFNPGLAAQLNQSGGVPKDRRLYEHQLEAVRLSAESTAHERPAILVTAGTGAGKTESFLLPMLNLLANEPSPTERRGVRCVILYPMNALVNDQVDRLYEWLRGQSDLTLFHFTSETPEDKKAADRDQVPVWEPCRFRTRQAARGLETSVGQKIDVPNEPRGPVPDILITNYSMLEYMLCRPQDSVFFGDALRCVILDEAHLYTGTLAAEITLLMRRVLDRCGLTPSDVLHVATSATLGGDDSELADFAATLFSKNRDLVHIIRGQFDRTLPNVTLAEPRTAPSPELVLQHTWLSEPTIRRDENGEPRLAVNDAACDALSESLSSIVGKRAVTMARKKADGFPARFLWAALAAAPVIRKLEEILWSERRLSLMDLSHRLWGNAGDEARHATTVLLQLGASARENVSDYPLVPHRLHFLVRVPSGSRLCLNTKCNGPSELKWAGLGAVCESAADKCPFCQSVAVELARCQNCGEVCICGWQRGSQLSGAPGNPVGTKVRLHVPSLVPDDVAQPLQTWVVNPESGEIRGDGADGTKLYRMETCPNCGESDDSLNPILGTSALGLAIVAETILAELPEFPGPHNKWLPARGRRLLTFSDSRREAARLGPLLVQQHERHLLRAAWIQCASHKPPVDEALLVDLQSEIKEFEDKLKGTSLTEAQRRRSEGQLESVKKEFASASSGGSLSEWAEAVAALPVTSELLDRETAGRHRAGKEQWDQAKFEMNRDVVRKTLQTHLMEELIRPYRGSSTPEDLGLLEVTYPGIRELEPPNGFLGILPDIASRDRLLDCWPDLLSALCETLRHDGAATLGETKADIEYGSDHVGRIGLWCSERDAFPNRLVRFVGERANQTRLTFARSVLEACVVSVDFAETLLSAAFAVLEQAAKSKQLAWLEYESDRQTTHGAVSGIRIRFAELGLRRPSQLFICPRTGWVWPRSVVGCAPQKGCTDLQAITDKELDDRSRVSRRRHEYRESPVFQMGLWAEEHSAQLSPAENRRLQDLFKAGIRNLLSSTTTLELGIDIGGLNAVFLSNVPPSNVNYMQRGGRSGRRADGSSAVVTFCRDRGFDRAVFGDFGNYLARQVRRPRVLLDRQRVVRRHAHAFLLGEFFRQVYPATMRVGAMRAYGQMGKFANAPLPLYWDKGSKPEIPTSVGEHSPLPCPDWWVTGLASSSLASRFSEFLRWAANHGAGSLRPKLQAILTNTPAAVNLDETEWPTFIVAISERYQSAIDEWLETYNGLLEAWKNVDAHADNAKRQANALRYQLIAFHEMTVIEALAEQQFLPRYGFPIGLHRLRVMSVTEDGTKKDAKPYIREEDQYRLERPGILAIREYVPGSRFFVGHRIVTSHGLLKHWSGNELDTAIGFRGLLATCINQHTYYSFGTELTQCPVCNETRRAGEPIQLLLPRFGFSTAAWDSPALRGEPSGFVGRTQLTTVTFTQPASAENNSITVIPDFAGLPGITARYREDGELLVYNSGDNGRGFALCLSCGFASSEIRPGMPAHDPLPADFLHHLPLTAIGGRTDCRSRNGCRELRHQFLSARQITDVVLFDLPQLANSDEPMAVTLGHALRLAGCRHLGLDSRELGSFVVATESGPFCGLVIYDSVPGGAGHVNELLGLGIDWLCAAKEILWVNESHDAACETACLDCILSFETQFDHDSGLLARAAGLAFLNAVLEGRQLPVRPTLIAVENNNNGRPELPNRDRLERAQQRLAARR